MEHGTVLEMYQTMIPKKTNVQKIFESICNIDPDGIMQIKHYIEGVGTSGNKLRQTIDGITGYGLDQNILSAYKFLVWNYVKGDQIYLFGFSRGAYTARSVAGLIRNCGILRNDDLSLINAAYKHYRNRKDKGWRPKGKKALDFRNRNSNETEIKFIGVWDTVGSLGIPLSIFKLINGRRYSFHDTALSSSVNNAFHALAIDKRRKNFTPTLWKQSEAAQTGKVIQIMEQQWFSGVHSNIGGGYPETGLSDITFTWIMEKAKSTGLAFEENYISQQIHPNIKGKLYNSLKFPFNFLPSFKRTIRLLKQYNADVDETAIKRWHTIEKYKPENLRHIIEKNGTNSTQG